MSPKGLPGSSKKNFFTAVIEVGCQCGDKHKVRVRSEDRMRRIRCWKPRCDAEIVVTLYPGRDNYKATVDGKTATYSKILWQE